MQSARQSISRTVSFGLALTAVLYTTRTFVPQNVIELPWQRQYAQYVGMPLLPQGWAFFTLSPREPWVIPYSVKDGAAKNEYQLPNALPSNYFGLSRKGRAQGLEVGQIQAKVPSGSWIRCHSPEADKCALEKGQKNQQMSIRVANPVPFPSLCGQITLVKEEPVPWAYRDMVKYKMRAVSHVALNLQCPKE